MGFPSKFHGTPGWVSLQFFSDFFYEFFGPYGSFWSTPYSWLCATCLFKSFDCFENTRATHTSLQNLENLRCSFTILIKFLNSTVHCGFLPKL